MQPPSMECTGKAGGCTPSIFCEKNIAGLGKIPHATMSHTWSNQRGYGFLAFDATCDRAATCEGVSRTRRFPWNRLEPLTGACKDHVQGTYLNRQSVDFTRTPAVHAAAYGTCEPCRVPAIGCTTPAVEHVLRCSPVSGVNVPPRTQCWHAS